MRLLRHSGAKWSYALERKEGILLRTLVGVFPLTAATAVKITRTGGDPKAAERQRLLNESLAQHREELKQQALKLLANKLKVAKGGWRLSLNMDEREVLLQLLNDIRVESWHALGEPENPDTLSPDACEVDFRHHQLIHAAGYFEWKIVGMRDGK